MSRANLGQMAAAVYFASGIQLKKDLNNLDSCVPLWGPHPPPVFIIDLSTTPQGLQEHLLEMQLKSIKIFTTVVLFQVAFQACHQMSSLQNISVPHCAFCRHSSSQFSTEKSDGTLGDLSLSLVAQLGSWFSLTFSGGFMAWSISVPILKWNSAFETIDLSIIDLNKGLLCNLNLLRKEAYFKNGHLLKHKFPMKRKWTISILLKE